MPGRTLPTFPQADVAAHNTAKSCYVTIGTKVYDVTDFLEDHPGGADLILQFAGKDVKEAMEDPISHAHSEAAWEMLDDYLVGFMATEKVMQAVKESDDPFAVLPMEPSKKGMAELEKADHDAAEDVRARKQVHAAGEEAENSNKALYSTGMSSEADLNKETDYTSDYKRHKFLDLNKPLLPQVWFGGFSKEFYLEQVHRPRHYKGGESAPLFGNFLEPLSKTPWWIVPTLWLPPVIFGTIISAQHLNPMSVPAQPRGDHSPLPPSWHPPLPPMDRLRLVMPPTLFAILATPFWYLAHTVFFYDFWAATCVYCGGIFGYICYDMTHYFLHHKNLPSYYRELKKYHLQHHFMDYENGFGVTSRFWDRIFGTELGPPPVPKVLKAQ
ncbi:hypothetical protein BTJ68_06021 [Hortaea werneckii EXF-2000]|uniref:Ceramide very long chain fatty acid hydroxylase n=1 Tax=Hortaea werneckii EXF-2000 TaxID=1157616 RepID=A0A1Z5TFH8_HORWE|nr:hypothetical protein BTJ68_06021 [Hortaea werneckii EXF-2000]